MPESGDCLDGYDVQSTHDFDYVWLRADCGNPVGETDNFTVLSSRLSFALSHNNNKQNPTTSQILLRD